MNKAVFIVLIVVAVAFAIVLGLGASNNQGSPPADQGNYSPPSWSSAIGSLLGSFSPGFKLSPSSFQIQGGSIQQISVPAASQSFRRATFQVTPCNRSNPPAQATLASITYKSVGNEGSDLKLDNQTWAGTKKNPCTGSLIILEHGGTLTLSCSPSQTCTITLQ
ncbi:MAG TPA: hypothetical protein VI455_12995 [Terriglobia bacterium]